MKKIIIILFVLLLCIVVLILLITSLLKKSPTQETLEKGIIPTSVPSLSEVTKNKVTEKVIEKDSTIKYSSKDFIVQYSSKDDRYTVTVLKKSSQADTKIEQWIKENKLDPTKVKIIEESPEGSKQATGLPDTIPTEPFARETKLLNDFINLFFQAPDLAISPNLTPTPSIVISDEKPTGQGLSYYSQCNDNFGDYSLPSGCTICKAGCGPTTVAMVLASLVNRGINPPVVVDLYKQKGFLLGCSGSYISDAKALLNQMGLKTTDLMVFNYLSADQVADDFRNYIQAGWLIFTLGKYCDAGCGHYFLISSVDNNNNIWTYDPYYGRFQDPPFNENRYYPFPKYRMAFGVKKI